MSPLPIELRLAKIRESAAGLLLKRRVHRLPVDPFELCRDEIRCDSVGSFCSKTRMTTLQITGDAGLEDGFTLFLPNGQYLILYNEKRVNAKRRAFTIAHELGHILLNHSSDTPGREREANLFASELLMPRVLIWELTRYKKTRPTPDDISVIFGVSRQAAGIRLEAGLDEKTPFSENEYLLLCRYRSSLSAAM